MESKIIDINEQLIKDRLSTMVKDTVEEMLNGMLDAEKRIDCVTQNGMSTLAPGKIPEPVIMTANCIQKREK
jgi:hypothetical protein